MLTVPRQECRTDAGCAVDDRDTIGDKGQTPVPFCPAINDHSNLAAIKVADQYLRLGRVNGCMVEDDPDTADIRSGQSRREVQPETPVSYALSIGPFVFAFGTDAEQDARFAKIGCELGADRATRLFCALCDL
ncbi:hypothetical protein ATE71_14045 [Sphingopyxis sp. H115]|nr:hypothetical protein ATE71_14045 [Sphingopyxis sp. H115]